MSGGQRGLVGLAIVRACVRAGYKNFVLRTHAQYGTRYLAAMPTNLYGPGDNYDSNRLM